MSVLRPSWNEHRFSPRPPRKRLPTSQTYSPLAYRPCFSHLLDANIRSFALHLLYLQSLPITNGFIAIFCVILLNSPPLYVCALSASIFLVILTSARPPSNLERRVLWAADRIASGRKILGFVPLVVSSWQSLSALSRLVHKTHERFQPTNDSLFVTFLFPGRPHPFFPILMPSFVFLALLALTTTPHIASAQNTTNATSSAVTPGTTTSALTPLASKTFNWNNLVRFSLSCRRARI